jgi:imidazolonepropionase-like amidohydrolase
MLYALEISAQKYFPENGPNNPREEHYALTHATLFVDYQTKVENATLIIKKGKVVAYGTNIPIPQDAINISMKGKFIYPAFVDLYTQYGMQWKSETTPSQREQFVSNKAKMPYGWNEAIRAEINATQYFQPDTKQAKILRSKGIAMVVTGIQDGICRGTSALVSTADVQAQDAVVQSQVAAGFSFNKGSSTQPYPSSLMGSVALIRQTYHDALWYQNNKEQTNLTNEALLTVMKLPGIFEVQDKQDIIRVGKIATEFKQRYIIKSAGDDYQMLPHIKKTSLPLIVPVNFPKAYDVNDMLDAENYSTTDLKHWEAAPFNLKYLADAGFEFAITSDGCEDGNTFFGNLHKAVSNGLDEKAALKALTETPAKWIGMMDKTGSLHKNKLANFIVTDAPLFSKECKLLETWCSGNSYTVNKAISLNPLGQYKIENSTDTLFIRQNTKQPKIKFSNDTLVSKTVIYENGYYQVQFGEKSNTQQILLWPLEIDSNEFPFAVRSFEMRKYDIAGNYQVTRVNKIGKEVEKKAEKDTVITNSALPEVWYPYTDYGRSVLPSQKTILFKNATVWTSESQGILTETDVLIKNGKILTIGKSLSVSDADVVDAKGMHLTAGIIDEHSHIAIKHGVNEGTQSVTAEVSIGDAIDYQDVNIYRQLSGGVIGAQLLHGSANVIGGQSALIKLRWGMDAEEMKIEGADGFIKFALGENVKQSNWGDRATVRYPQTRMGVEQVLMDAFTRAKAYERQKNKRVDLELEALVEILNKKRFISCHSYVQSEINMLMHVADSFKFKVNTFTHILEGYKVADKMKKHGVNASTFADWWGYKYEVIEAIPYNAAILTRMGVNTAINSDDAEMGRRLNQEAAKAIKYGALTEEEAWNMVTINPATMLHINHKTGSIKVGKDADIVLWSDNPLSIYAKAMQTYVDGRKMFSRDEDELMRKKIQLERNRIIQLMYKAKLAGESSHSKTSRKQIVYHCDTENEEEEHNHE